MVGRFRRPASGAVVVSFVAMCTPRLLTAREVAERLGVRPGTVYSWISRGVIPHVRLSARLSRIPEDELDKWLAERLVRPVEDRR